MSREDEIREAVEQAFLVSQMTDTVGWMELHRSVRERLTAIKREVLSGEAGERYRELCGFINGAEYVLATPERLEETAQALRKG